MKLKVTSEILLSVQLSATNIVGDLVAHTEKLMSTGKVQCDLSWFSSDVAKEKGYDQVWPAISNEADQLTGKVASCEVDLTEAEVVAANLPLTIYNKVAAKLHDVYGWTVIVE